ncbi:MAG: hypothetical protein E6Q39_00020 [Crocinitomicaceae bacterium]|nr:MAG: hypothetical protein E6Q39_00020 [Crocinitomicaceae bacterium]
MPKFVKKPVEIEAIQWTGDNYAEIYHFLEGDDSPASEWGENLHIETRGDTELLYIHTLEGTMLARIGDWIVKGIKGDFYPCKPDIFELTYSKV